MHCPQIVSNFWGQSTKGSLLYFIWLSNSNSRGAVAIDAVTPLQFYLSVQGYQP